MPDVYKQSFKQNYTNNIELSIFNCGLERCAPGQTWGPGIRDHYLIHLVVSGKGIFEVGGRTWEVSEGDLFFARPSQLIRYTADEQQPWEYSWVGFNGACAHKLAAQLPFTDDAPVHHTSDPDGMRAALTNIYSSRGLQPQDEAAMVGYLYLFIAALMRETSAGKPHTASSSSQYVLNEIGNALCAFFAQQGIRPYDEQSGKGLVRHIFLRRGAHSGQIMVCLVCTRAKLPHAEQLCTALREQFPAISTILLNVNAQNTNVILGSENHILYGPGYIEDTLCGVPVRLGPLSFYQVNTLAAERLYGVAAQYAQLTPDDTLLDLYCGMGTIGLSMAEQCRELIGVEIVPEAIESAKANAARMGKAVAAKSRFFCADAGQAATQLAAEGLHPDIVMLDPPRKGCDEATLSAVVRMAPRRVVYVSCNPATAARDAAWLEQNGYHAEKVQPVDLFPRTKHCECVIALSKGEIDSKKVRVEFSLEGMDTSGLQKGATYPEIKARVLEQTGLKVSSLYISQVKQKCGLEVRENHHKAKSENTKQPQCPKEKEDAIVEALKHFQMI